MKVRKVRCASCGAPKVGHTTSAYVYCDYCAQYMDWDVQVAKYNGKVAAGPHYRELCKQLEPELAAARAAGDRERLAAAHRAIFDVYIDDCANSYSPRIKDPAYREDILRRQVLAQVVTDLDPRCATTMAALNAAIAGLEYTFVGEHKYDQNWQLIASPKAQPTAKTFWRLYDAYTANALAIAAALDELPAYKPDPDDTPPALAAKVRDSLLVQAWIELLDPALADELLARTRLHDEYDDIEAPAFHDTQCKRCRAAIRAPEGARKNVCVACGFVTALGAAGFCGFCGAPIEYGLGAKTATCTHCKSEMRLMTE